MQRLRRKAERWGISAVMGYRSGRPRRKKIKAGTIELLCRLKRDVYPDFSLQHFYEHVTEKHGVKISYNWLRVMLQEAGVIQKDESRVSSTHNMKLLTRTMKIALIELP